MDKPARLNHPDVSRQARSTENTLVTSSEEKMCEVLATLEECQTKLALGGYRDTAQLLSVAILELRIKLNRIQDSELRVLCDAMLREVEATERSYHPKPQGSQLARPPFSLKLVK
jgi:hypothetical protein